MNIIDRRLTGVRYVSDEDNFECYLHQSNLALHEFTVVEHFAKGRDSYDILEFDTEGPARAAYAEALARTKARIQEALA